MNSTQCWCCERLFNYEGEKYCDTICPFCGTLNSIYDPTKHEPIPKDFAKETEEEYKKGVLKNETRSI